MSIIQSIILGIVQGITEFFPISSSGHLILVPALFGWRDQGVAFDVMLHGGTLVALLWVFRADIARLFRGALGKLQDNDRREAWMILAAAIPGLAFGYFFGDAVEMALRAPMWVAFGLAFWGIILWIADIRASKRTRSTVSVQAMTWKQAMIVGFSQMVAFFPGTSRSGITATGGLFSGLDRKTAVRFSFLVSIPTVGVAATYGILKLVKNGIDGGSLLTLGLGFISAALAGIWAILFLRTYVETHSFKSFAIYRIILAAIILIVLR
jgi:undecaprenyl-diphosphatase